MRNFRWHILLWILFGFFTAPSGLPADELDLNLYARILEQHTRKSFGPVGTEVDYRALSNSVEWARLKKSLTESNLSPEASRAEKIAFWINAYNILAIDLVIQHYPVSSIKEAGSLLKPVWGRPAGIVGGRRYSLGEIEHQILRPMGEPRIHFAIVCASTSCPSLRRVPYHAAFLEEELEESVRSFLKNMDKGMRIYEGQKRVGMSSIFKWFEEDFEEGGGVTAFLLKSAPVSSRKWLQQNRDELRFYYLDYDWSLNDYQRLSSSTIGQ